MYIQPLHVRRDGCEQPIAPPPPPPLSRRSTSLLDGKGRARLPVLRQLPWPHPDIRQRHCVREEAGRVVERVEGAGDSSARADAAAAEAEEPGEQRGG